MNVDIQKKKGEYLIFQLMDELFAFPTDKTIEIVRTERITFLPKMESFFCGVMNLRGELVPSVDLRLLLGMEWIQSTKETVFVLLEILSEEESYKTAVRVDKVIAVEKIPENLITEAPESGSLVNEKYLTESFIYKDSIVFILSADILFSPQEIGLSQ